MLGKVIDMHIRDMLVEIGKLLEDMTEEELEKLLKMVMLIQFNHKAMSTEH